MGRIASREFIFNLVFELNFHKPEDGNYFEEYLSEHDDMNEEDKDFISSYYTDIIDKYPELETIVAKYLVGYTLDRVYKVDLSILILAIYELKYRKDVPVEIVANEAVELAKKFSTSKSYQFINGVIASAVKDLR